MWIVSVALLIVCTSNDKSYCYNILNAMNRPSVTLKNSWVLHTNKDRDPHEHTHRHQHTLRLFSVTNYDSPHCILGQLNQLICTFSWGWITARCLQSITSADTLWVHRWRQEVSRRKWMRVKRLNHCTDRPTQTSQTQRRNTGWEKRKSKKETKRRKKHQCLKHYFIAYRLFNI